MRRPAAVRARVKQPQLIFPGIQQHERPRGSRNFVAQIVRPAAVRIHIIKMLVQVLRQKPRHHIEIFVVMRRQPARVALGFEGAQPSAGRLRAISSSGVASMKA